MRWGLQVLPNVLVVRLYGMIDQDVGNLFEKTTGRAVRLGNRPVIMDFAGVESIAPLGLVFCEFGFNHMRELGIVLAVLHPPVCLSPILQKFGLESLPSGLVGEQPDLFRN
jgi:hypothetical protein